MTRYLKQRPYLISILNIENQTKYMKWVLNNQQHRTIILEEIKERKKYQNTTWWQFQELKVNSNSTCSDEDRWVPACEGA